MYSIIALIGKSGSGKDTLLKTITEENGDLHRIVNYTSRPIRENEKDGIDYFYLTTFEFLYEINSGEILEYSNFNNWYYGIGVNSLDENKINIGVLNPKEVEALKDKVDLTVYYVNASDKTRLLRQLNREDNPNVSEIIRRFSADEEDFRNLNFDYKIVNNEGPDDLRAAANEILGACAPQGNFR